ncbi:MAG: hypothetical protein RL653_3035 [Pseudomonadota bacterium]|jgi:hypothetical protein
MRAVLVVCALAPALALAQPALGGKRACLVSVIQASPGPKKGPLEVDAALRPFEAAFKSGAWKRFRSFKIVTQARYDATPGTRASLSVDKDQVQLAFAAGTQRDGKLHGTFGLGDKPGPFALGADEVALRPASASAKGQRLYGLHCPTP